jgi:predicted amidohydrolase YtcJ
MDESTPASVRTQCIVVDEGRIVGKGSLKEVREEWGDLETLGSKLAKVKGGMRIFYLEDGQTMLPGLIDAHAHVLAYGESKSAVDLVGATSVKGAFSYPLRIASCSFCSYRRRQPHRRLH